MSNSDASTYESSAPFTFAPGNWRIRPTVLLLIARPQDGALLVQQTRCSGDDELRWRLPGGGLEFGETLEAAARRHAREELAAELSFIHLLQPIEMFFHTPGEPRHELAFICTAAFADPALFQRSAFTSIDGDGSNALWAPQQHLLAALAQHPPRLYPPELAHRLQSLASDPEFCRGIWAGFREARPRIRVATRCLMRRPDDHAWLVIEGFDEHKNERFFFPPGGGMHFGETSEQAIRREVSEEFATALHSLRLITTLENHFVHRGTPGHEAIFIYTADPADRSLFARDEIPLIDGGEALIASWRSSSFFRSRLKPDAPPLYPEGVMDIVQSLEDNRQ